jgi:hypothetical protein
MRKMMYIVNMNTKKPNRRKMNKARIWGSIPQDVGDQLDYWYVKLGIPKTALVALCVQAGLKAVIRGIAPEEAFTPEQWQKILNLKDKTEGDIEKTT